MNKNRWPSSPAPPSGPRDDRMMVLFLVGLVCPLALLFFSTPLLLASMGLVPLAVFALSRKLLLGAGIILVALSVVLFFNSFSFVSKAIVTDGVVVAPNSDERSDYTVSFQAYDGSTVRFPVSTISPFHAGDRVRVVYKPGDPAQAKINSVNDNLWGWPAATLALGLIALGCTGWWSHRIPGVWRITDYINRNCNVIE